MTVQVEAPGLTVATCDCCGERAHLDVETGAAGPTTIRDALVALGWRRYRPEHVPFPGGFVKPYVATFENDHCPDCQTDEPRPAPRFGAHRRSAARIGCDDPCDEWPRSLIFAAAGLRPSCGHPLGSEPCTWCELGVPIGDSRPGWRR